MEEETNVKGVHWVELEQEVSCENEESNKHHMLLPLNPGDDWWSRVSEPADMFCYCGEV